MEEWLTAGILTIYVILVGWYCTDNYFSDISYERAFKDRRDVDKHPAIFKIYVRAVTAITLPLGFFVLGAVGDTRSNLAGLGFMAAVIGMFGLYLLGLSDERYDWLDEVEKLRKRAGERREKE